VPNRNCADLSHVALPMVKTARSVARRRNFETTIFSQQRGLPIGFFNSCGLTQASDSLTRIDSLSDRFGPAHCCRV